MRQQLLFDEINALQADLTAQKASVEGDNTEVVKLDKDKCIDAVLDILIMAYVYGENDVLDGLVGENTATSLKSPDTKQMKPVIEKPIEGKTFEDRIGEYADAGDIPSIVRVAETEAHRVYNQSAYEAAGRNGARYKTWQGVGDERERDTHFYLNDTTIPINAEFYTYTGAHSLYPGQFGVAEEDINCRCWVTYSK